MKNYVPKRAENAQKSKLALPYPRKPPFPFLYINPYDTGSIFFFCQKCALFSIPFHENFSIGRNFGLNPVSKKLWTGGESYKWAKKGLHRALFIGISHLHTRDGDWIGQIFRPVGSVFLHVAKVARNFGPNFMKISRFFSKKILHRANIFQWLFWPSRRPLFGHFFGHFFGSFSGYFSGDFSRKFSWDFLVKFRRYFLLWKSLNKIKWWLLHPPTRDVTMMIYSSASWAHRAHVSEQLHARERSVNRGPSV